MLIGSNAFRLMRHYTAKGQGLDHHLDEAIPAAPAVLHTCQPIELASEEYAWRLKRLLDAHGMVGPSFYTNCRLHDDSAVGSMVRVIQQA